MTVHRTVCLPKATGSTTRSRRQTAHQTARPQHPVKVLNPPALQVGSSRGTEVAGEIARHLPYD